MSFSRVLCVRDRRSMYAFRRIPANSVVFIILNKLLPSPDTLCFFPHVVIDEPALNVAPSMHSLIPVFVKQKANKMERVQVCLSVKIFLFVCFHSVALPQYKKILKTETQIPGSFIVASAHQTDSQSHLLS